MNRSAYIQFYLPSGHESVQHSHDVVRVTDNNIRIKRAKFNEDMKALTMAGMLDTIETIETLESMMGLLVKGPAEKIDSLLNYVNIMQHGKGNYYGS